MQLNTRALFAEWLKIRFPDVYQNMRRSASGLSGLSASDAVTATNVATTNSTGVSWLDSVLQAVGPIAQTKAQLDLINLNAKRAEQGLPPIDVAQVSPQVNVGVSKNVMTMGYVAIGGLMLLGIAGLLRSKR